MTTETTDDQIAARPDGELPEAPADESATSGSVEAAASEPYRVLARKYRPLTFDALIGQEAMVRTLTNAMALDRVAHAFILTGVRGVGKTTTARIIARALNCVGPDGTAGPTIQPCGVCEPCRAIIEDRHVDVMEMDAASRTGVDDIREIIDGVRYRPVSARFKIYIIDEVHMLSKSAFNALLKTLEEPPEHVKFIFATTEIRKVPVTVLSRCQRFDLRRVDQDELAGYLGDIAAKESANVEPDALALVARAADGSVRDGLSLLDQAIAHAGAAAVTAEAARDMLGLADRAQVLDLFEQVTKGDIAAALDLLGEMYRAGADPVVVLQDLLEVVHWLTKLKIIKDAAESAAVSETERGRGREMAGGLPMAALTRSWQMLLKGLGEVQQSDRPLFAAEMVLVRLAYATELPSPADLVKTLDAEPGVAGATPAKTALTQTPQSGGAAVASGATPSAVSAGPVGPDGGASAGRAQAALATQSEEAVFPLQEEPPVPQSSDAAPVMPQSFEGLVTLFEERREAVTASHLYDELHLVRYEPGRIEFRPGPGAPPDLANRLKQRLEEWTGTRWAVTVSSEPGAPTLRDQHDTAARARRDEARSHPLVEAALDLFPDAEIVDVLPIEPGTGGAGGAVPGPDDEEKS